MKVAYCLSGFMREFKYNNFIERMVKNVPGDVFIHTWNTYNSKDSAESYESNFLNINDVHDYYNPKKMIVEDQSKLKIPSCVNKDVLRYHYMWTSISESLALASCDDYDVVVRFRPDLEVQSPLSKDEIEFASNNVGTMFVGLSDDCYHAGILTDNFAFGHPLVMQEYQKHSIMSLIYRQKHSSNERALTNYLINCQHIEKFKPSSLIYQIKRMDGTLVPNGQTIKTLAPGF